MLLIIILDLLTMEAKDYCVSRFLVKPKEVLFVLLIMYRQPVYLSRTADVLLQSWLI